MDNFYSTFDDDDLFLPYLDTGEEGINNANCDLSGNPTDRADIQHPHVSFNNGGLYISDAAIGGNAYVDGATTPNMLDAGFNLDDLCYLPPLDQSTADADGDRESPLSDGEGGSGASDATTASSSTPCRTDTYEDAEHGGGAAHRRKRRRQGTTSGSSSAAAATTGEGAKSQAIAERCAALEQQNAALISELGRLGATPAMLQQQYAQRIEALRDIIGAFNEGDGDNVSDAVRRTCSPVCSLVTPSIFQQLTGHFAMTRLFTVLLEAFPDALIELQQPTVQACGSVFAQFTFTGTKVFGLPTDVLLRQWQLVRQQRAKAASEAGGKERQGADDAAASAESGGVRQRSGSTGISLFNVLKATQTYNAAMRWDARGGGGSRTSGAPVSLENHHGPASPPPNAHAHAHAGSKSSSQPSVKLAGHIVMMFDATNRCSKLVFVWNCTSMMSQVFGGSSDDEGAGSIGQFFIHVLSRLHRPPKDLDDADTSNTK